MSEPTKFGVLMLVGPGDTPREQARDTLESLFAYEANPWVLLVDDHPAGRDLGSGISACLGRPIRSIRNPRCGRGSGWEAGATAGVLAGLQELARTRSDLHFVLKIDTDSLIINPFAESIRSRFAVEPTLGMLGYYRFDPSRVPDTAPNFLAAPAFSKLMRRFTIWRRTPAGGGPRLQVGWWGKDRRIRNCIRQALQNGYRLGEHCNGGGYAISGEALRRFQQAKLLEHPCQWLKTPCGEDVVTALYVRSVGLELGDFNADGEPFGIKNWGLVDSPENLVKRGFGIVHSVKDHGGRLERETRAFFRRRRTSDGSNVKGPLSSFGN